MKSIIAYSLILLVILSSCTKKSKQSDNREEKFTSELIALKKFFQIPGLAVSIQKNGNNIYQNYLGVSDIEKQTELDSTVLFPIASITKVFSGVLIMKLVEQQKLSLEEPINNYLDAPIQQDSILIKHILSHTSQGNIGTEFYYSSRFGILTRVIEKASNKSFKEFMNQEILMPLQLKNTFLLKDSLQITEENRKIAKPYVLNEGTKKGFIDFGYSTSAGIVSNLNDLAIFNDALDTNTLISEESKNLMFSSFKDDLPYGYGIFSQEIEDLQLVWAYGQYDCYSSLFLKIPSKKITLTLLANNNLLSDPARLIYGDATSSLFVISFLKNYIYKHGEMELLELLDTTEIVSTYPKSTFHRKKLLAQALSESFMARFDPEKIKTSSKILEYTFSQYPNYQEYADLNLLHNLSFLKDVSFYMDLGEFNTFDTQIELIGEKLIKETPKSPYVHIYLGTYYDRKGNTEKAKYHFESIVNAKNFSKNWYTQEAQNWLNNH
ncbi:serine hydrolase [Aquimarina sp. Aq107]|uniref:serine hydrolase domain-containing protein n=1 Tax=Aquimarina sp. Aq107 TaxID=1191912 RepID=UPI000D54BA5E|nr:serine hydrolase domain-containing protein [Aquimarina sp. Aq107]